MLCLFLQRQCSGSTRMRWSPSTNKSDNKSVGSSITSCHQSTARTKTWEFATGDISWKTWWNVKSSQFSMSSLPWRRGWLALLLICRIREKECNCLCAKRNKTPIRVLAYRTGASFFAFFRRAKHEAGIPFPVARVSSVSRAPAHSMKCFPSLA